MLKSYAFRKKPIVIEAFQMTNARRLDHSDWPSWLREAGNKSMTETGALYNAGPVMRLVTLEGRMDVVSDDWIIRGVKGELYPCKPDIFAATYEPLET